MSEPYIEGAMREKREFDVELCHYFRVKYGPFNVTGELTGSAGARVATKCDFCGSSDNKSLTRLTSATNGKPLYVCDCGALVLLLSGEEAARAALNKLLQPADMTVPSDPVTAKLMGEAEDAISAIEKLKSHESEYDRMHRVVREAKGQIDMGKGRGWKILPSLMKQYDERKSLTKKQVDVLVKFLNSCKER